MNMPRLFEPFRIGHLTVPNRVIMAPMNVGYAGIRGEVTEQLLAYYETRARSGVGMVIVEASYVREDGRNLYGALGIYSDELLPGLSRLAEAIKCHGPVAAIEIVHAGIQANVSEPVGPSAIGRKLHPPSRTPRELSTREVEELIEAFAKAAARAKQAGFDAVEIHGTHGYLITQFLSPLTNRRSDKYGVDRVLFALEVVRRVKELCGKGYPVMFRLDASEFEPGGIDIEYAKQIARRLEDEGVDALDITGGNHDTRDMIIPPYFYSAEEGWFFKLSREIKKVVNIPVISGGLVTSPEVAEKAIENGYCDAIFIGRQLIADPQWFRKVREGRVDDIRPCLACNEGCIGRVISSKPTWCTVNALTGFEYKWQDEESLPKATIKKHVVVVGGGPAGLEAARVAAIRGHRVTLVEEDDKLGGTAVIASIPRFLTGNKLRISRLLRWYEKQLKKLSVEVILNTKATPEMLEELRPDVVVIATGSRPFIPKIPGVENAVTVDEILMGRASVGSSVAIVGGGLVGVEVALYLAVEGKAVTVIEALPEVARDAEPISKMALTRPGGLLEKHGVKVLTNSIVIEIRRGGVEILTSLFERRYVEADTVVLAVGRTPNVDQNLVEAARKLSREVYIVGDAKSPRKIINAIHEGFTIALNI